MWVEFINTLRKLRGTVLGWGIGLLAYDWLIGSMYGLIVEMGEQMGELLKSYPPQLLAFFPSIAEFTSPIGFMDTYFSAYMMLFLGIFATGTAARLLVREEEEGILDLVMSYPISRNRLFWGRFLAYLTATVLILTASWLGWVIPSKSAGNPLTALELGMPMVPLFAIMVMFGALALFLSMLLPASRIAGGLSAALLVSNFLLVGMANINEDLLPIYELTPLHFYQGAKFIEDPNWGWLLGLLGVAAVFALSAWLLFLRRDIRVGGEAGWQLPIRLGK